MTIAYWDGPIVATRFFSRSQSGRPAESLAVTIPQRADNFDMGHFYDVDVYRQEDEDGGEPWWGAEGGLENNSVGVDFESTQDLAELINGVHDETIAFRKRWPDLQVRWFEGRQPATDFLAAAQAAGIGLP